MHDSLVFQASLIVIENPSGLRSPTLQLQFHPKKWKCRESESKSFQTFIRDTNHHTFETCLSLESMIYLSHNTKCRMIFSKMCHISFSIIYSCFSIFRLPFRLSCSTFWMSLILDKWAVVTLWGGKIQLHSTFQRF